MSVKAQRDSNVNRILLDMGTVVPFVAHCVELGPGVLVVEPKFSAGFQEQRVVKIVDEVFARFDVSEPFMNRVKFSL